LFRFPHKLSDGGEALVIIIGIFLILLLYLIVIFGIPIVAFIAWNWYLKKQEKLQEGNIAFFRAKEIIKTTKKSKNNVSLRIQNLK